VGYFHNSHHHFAPSLAILPLVEATEHQKLFEPFLQK